MTLGQRIYSLRVQKHLSQEALGRMVGVSWVTVNRWENDKAKPTRRHFKKLVRMGLPEQEE